jgi:hypothetical protein
MDQILCIAVRYVSCIWKEKKVTLTGEWNPDFPLEGNVRLYIETEATDPPSFIRFRFAGLMTEVLRQPIQKNSRVDVYIALEDMIGLREHMFTHFSSALESFSQTQDYRNIADPTMKQRAHAGPPIRLKGSFEGSAVKIQSIEINYGTSKLNAIRVKPTDKAPFIILEPEGGKADSPAPRLHIAYYNDLKEEMQASGTDLIIDIPSTEIAQLISSIDTAFAGFIKE